MTDTPHLAILFLGPRSPLADQIESWLATCLQGPLTLCRIHSLSEAQEHLRTHQVDLILLDLTLHAPDSEDPLPVLRAISPTSGRLVLTPHADESLILELLCRGAHDTLALATTSHPEAVRTIARTLARVRLRWPTLSLSLPLPATSTRSHNLIHDLNNVMTSINGFADLLLMRLAPHDAARSSAEEIRKAGRRAVTLLKSHATPADIAAPASDIAKAA